MRDQGAMIFRRFFERVALAICVAIVIAPAVLVGQHGGRIERIIDGDTIVVVGVGAVRLIGVDAPELTDSRPDVQALAKEAAEGTTALAAGYLVRLEYEGRQKDRYGRLLAYVYLPDGRLLNREIIRAGFANAYTEYPFSKMEEFRALEREARAAGRGLWMPALERARHAPYAPPAAPSARGLLDTTAGAAPAAPAESGSNANATVYVTRTGAKYHSAGCRHLSRSQISMALKEASARYGPCNVCDPPTLSATPAPVGAAAATPVERAATPPPSRPAPSGRCQATTKKGTQCSRSAQPGRSYCWQH